MNNLSQIIHLSKFHCNFSKHKYKKDKKLIKQIEDLKIRLVEELKNNLKVSTKKSYSQKKGTYVTKNKSLSDYKGYSKAAINSALPNPLRVREVN